MKTIDLLTLIKDFDRVTTDLNNNEDFIISSKSGKFVLLSLDKYNDLLQNIYKIKSIENDSKLQK